MVGLVGTGQQQNNTIGAQMDPIWRGIHAASFQLASLIQDHITHIQSLTIAKEAKWQRHQVFAK